MTTRTLARLAAPLALATLLAACKSTDRDPPTGQEWLEEPGAEGQLDAATTEESDPGDFSNGPVLVKAQRELIDQWFMDQYGRFGLQFQEGLMVPQPELMIPSVWFPDDVPFVKGPTGGWSRQDVHGGIELSHTWPQLTYQPTIQIVPQPEHQEAVNQQAWIAHRDFLSGLPQGTWVVIAYGLLQGTHATAEEAWKAAAELGEHVHHAYVYRVGIDDQPESVVLSPMAWDSPNWTQAGRSLARHWKLVMEAANDTWHRGTESITWGDAGARFELVGTNGLRRRVPGVISAMVQQDLTVTREDAEALGLLRFQSPMPCTYGRPAEACPRVLIRVEVPELGLSSVAMAVMLP